MVDGDCYDRCVHRGVRSAARYVACSFAGIGLMLSACGTAPEEISSRSSGGGIDVDPGDVRRPASDVGASTQAEGGDDQSVGHDSPGFSEAILPIVRARCVQCHAGDQIGADHLRLETVGDIVDSAGSIALYVDLGLMPPWPASPRSAAFDPHLGLAETEVEAIVEWERSGAAVDAAMDMPIVDPARVRHEVGHDIEIVP